MTVEVLAPTSPKVSAIHRPRLGFLGVGWIGRHRMQAMLETGLVDAVGLSEPSQEQAVEALRLMPGAERVETLDELLALNLDGLVIATPSALHAEQSIYALARGVAVFCQKPLGRSAAETRAVVDAARAAGRLLGVDLSYRLTDGMQRIRQLVQAGNLGEVFAVDLVFHNAYGPDKVWFYDPEQSGGGCVIDLGVHLVDLALWTLDFPEVRRVSSSLFAGGKPLGEQPNRVEDYAVATVELESGAVVRIACSWKLHAGCDAVISAAVHGFLGGAEMRNVAGSFYDFTTERYRGAKRETISSPPEDWGGRAAADWVRRLAAGEGFNPGIERLVQVAHVLDQIYGR